VSDAAGQENVESVTVSEPPLLNVPDTCFPITLGYAAAQPVSGTPPYSYLWNTDPVQVTDTAFGLAPGTYSCAITDARGCTTVGSYEVDAIGCGLSLDELRHQIQLYPNPGTEAFTLSSDHLMEHCIVQDLQGRTLFESCESTQLLRIDTRHWPSGTYLVRVSTAKGSQAYRRVKNE